MPGATQLTHTTTVTRCSSPHNGQVVNMNGATMNPGGNGPTPNSTVTTNNSLPSPNIIATKTGAPRMIVGQQVIGARPGQPAVFEYTSEFSEFLKKSAHAAAANKGSATAPPPEPNRDGGSGSPAADDAKPHEFIAQISQDSAALSSTVSTTVSSSTVLVKPFNKEKETETATALATLITHLDPPPSPQKSLMSALSPETPISLPAKPFSPPPPPSSPPKSLEVTTALSPEPDLSLIVSEVSASDFFNTSTEESHLLSPKVVGEPDGEPHHRFTTDPALHSQFLEYAEAHPLGIGGGGGGSGGSEPSKLIIRHTSSSAEPKSPLIPSPVSIQHPPVLGGGSTSSGFQQPRYNSIPNNPNYSHVPPNQYHQQNNSRTKLPEPAPTSRPNYYGSYPPPVMPVSSQFIQTPPQEPMKYHQPSPPQPQYPVLSSQNTRPMRQLHLPTPPHPRPLDRSQYDLHHHSQPSHWGNYPVQPQLSPSHSLPKPTSPSSSHHPRNPPNLWIPPSSQQHTLYHSGISSHSSVVDQIPPIFGISQGHDRPPPPPPPLPLHSVAHSTSSSNYAQYPPYPRSSYRDPNSQFSGSGVGVKVGNSLQSGYYPSSRYPPVGLESAQNGPRSLGGHPGMAPSGSGGYPVVCRVTPIRSRLETAPHPERAYPIPAFPKAPYIPPRPPPPHPHPPFSRDERNGPLPPNSYLQRLDYDSYNYSCQYNDAMRRLSTQFTLQALPGLPGAQGHHLLVKTENGQYQLIRVVQPTPSAPTAATGTPSSHPTPSQPSPVVTTTTTTMTATPTMTAAVGQVLGPIVPTSTNTILATTAAPSSSVPSTSSISIPPSSKTTIVVNPSSGSGGVVGSNVLTSPTTTSVVPPPPPPKPTPTTSSSVPPPPVTPTVVTPSTSTPVFMTSSSSINTNHSSNSSTLNPNVNSRLQSPTVPPAQASNSPSGVGMTASMSMQQLQMHPQHQVILPPPLPQALPSYLPSSVLTSTTTASSTIAATATTVSQMTPDTAKQKCKNFLSFLLELSAKQNQTVARNVRGLIQGLVDGRVNAEDFSDRLQKEVNSQPQPCLVGFLKKSLPPLRQSLASKELTIDGIRPPPISSLTTMVPPSQSILPPQIRQPMPVPPTPVRIITPINTSLNSFPSGAPVIPSTTPIPRSTVAAVQQRFATPPKSSPKSKAAKAEKAEGSPSTPKSTGSKGKEKVDKKSFASSGTYGGDDDINDVAAMGGVNLAEESQRILGSTEMIGTQIRSCRDEPFFQGTSLQAKIKAIAAKHGLEEPPPEVVAMISHATEERMKTMLEKLSVIAEHRLDVIKLDDRYEVTQDVKGQLRFLEDLEKLERKRHDEQEREMLIKAAKSRSKSEDPEQAKLKAKAKEMQRVAQEELRQREANLTALQAIGPRKKPKLDIPLGSQSTIAQSPAAGLGALSNSGRAHIPMRPRLKRVNMRDVLFLLESEGETRRSEYLYTQMLK